MFSFQKLRVYQDAKGLTKDVYTLLEKFPNDEKYALCNQLRRAVVSVPSNIAEGISRNTNKEKFHFLGISYGSLMEVLCQLELAFEMNYIIKEELDELEKKIEIVAKEISGLRKSFAPTN